MHSQAHRNTPTRIIYVYNYAVCLLILFLFRLYIYVYISSILLHHPELVYFHIFSKEDIQEFVDPARPNKAQYIAAVPPADVEMTDAEKARRYFMTLQTVMQTDPC